MDHHYSWNDTFEYCFALAISMTPLTEVNRREAF